MLENLLFQNKTSLSVIVNKTEIKYLFFLCSPVSNECSVSTNPYLFAGWNLKHLGTETMGQTKEILLHFKKSACLIGYVNSIYSLTVL